jgi:predicted transcriptional regulator
MTEQEVRKGGGGKLSRSETVTVRLDPKLRYLAELAARLHRRTLSSYIEWAIKQSLDSEAVRPTGYTSDAAAGFTIGNEAEYLWDVDDADRFAKLALRYPHLLTHEEQVRWKLIRENGYLWKGSYAGRQKEWTWAVDEDSFNFQRLRNHWPAFCDVANGSSGQDSLPTWQKTDPISATARMSKPPITSAIAGTDDDIPF